MGDMETAMEMETTGNAWVIECEQGAYESDWRGWIVGVFTNEELARGALATLEAAEAARSAERLAAFTARWEARDEMERARDTLGRRTLESEFEWSEQGARLSYSLTAFPVNTIADPEVPR